MSLYSKKKDEYKNLVNNSIGKIPTLIGTLYKNLFNTFFTIKNGIYTIGDKIISLKHFLGYWVFKNVSTTAEAFDKINELDDINNKLTTYLESSIAEPIRKVLDIIPLIQMPLDRLFMIPHNPRKKLLNKDALEDFYLDADYEKLITYPEINIPFTIPYHKIKEYMDKYGKDNIAVRLHLYTDMLAQNDLSYPNTSQILPETILNETITSSSNTGGLKNDLIFENGKGGLTFLPTVWKSHSKIIIEDSQFSSISDTDTPTPLFGTIDYTGHYSMGIFMKDNRSQYDSCTAQDIDGYIWHQTENSLTITDAYISTNTETNGYLITPVIDYTRIRYAPDQYKYLPHMYLYAPNSSTYFLALRFFNYIYNTFNVVNTVSLLTYMCEITMEDYNYIYTIFNTQYPIINESTVYSFTSTGIFSDSTVMNSHYTTCFNTHLLSSFIYIIRYKNSPLYKRIHITEENIINDIRNKYIHGVFNITKDWTFLAISKYIIGTNINTNADDFIIISLDQQSIISIQDEEIVLIMPIIYKPDILSTNDPYLYILIISNKHIYVARMLLNSDDSISSESIRPVANAQGDILLTSLNTYSNIPIFLQLQNGVFTGIGFAPEQKEGTNIRHFIKLTNIQYIWTLLFNKFKNSDEWEENSIKINVNYTYFNFLEEFSICFSNIEEEDLSLETTNICYKSYPIFNKTDNYITSFLEINPAVNISNLIIHTLFYNLSPSSTSDIISIKAYDLTNRVLLYENEYTDFNYKNNEIINITDHIKSLYENNEVQNYINFDIYLQSQNYDVPLTQIQAYLTIERTDI